MSQKIIRFPEPIRSAVGIKMDMFKLRVLMLKALDELVMDVDEERQS